MDFTDLLYKGMTREQVIRSKTTDPQRRSFLSNARGGKVELTSEQCQELCKLCNNLAYFPGAEARIRQYRITDETVDRYGDIVRAQGITFVNYRKNPVVQFAHDYSQPPVGNAIKIWYDQDVKCVMAWALFFDHSLDPTGRADLIFRLVNANAMNACSLGFIPQTYNDPASDDERRKLGLGKYGVEYLTSDLTEFSPVPVPANPKALQEAYVKQYREDLRKTLQTGLFTKRDVDVLRKFPDYGSAVIDTFIRELDARKQVLRAEPQEEEPILEPIPPASDKNKKALEGEALEQALVNFFRLNPDPSDEQVHKWAEELKLDPSTVEQAAYELATDFSFMKQEWEMETPDATALAEGIKVEFEHTIDEGEESQEIAALIATAHINEDEEYYEKLVEMESGEKAAPALSIDISGITKEITLFNDQMKAVSVEVREALSQLRRDLDEVLATARKAAALVEQKAEIRQLYDVMGVRPPRRG